MKETRHQKAPQSKNFYEEIAREVWKCRPHKDKFDMNVFARIYKEDGKSPHLCNSTCCLAGTGYMIKMKGVELGRNGNQILPFGSANLQKWLDIEEELFGPKCTSVTRTLDWPYPISFMYYSLYKTELAGLLALRWYLLTEFGMLISLPREVLKYKKDFPGAFDLAGYKI